MIEIKKIKIAEAIKGGGDSEPKDPPPPPILFPPKQGSEK